MALGIGDLEGDEPWRFCAAHDDYQLSVEEAHGGGLETLETGGIAIADGLERTCSRHLKFQLIVSLGNEVAIGIGMVGVMSKTSASTVRAWA